MVSFSASSPFSTDIYLSFYRVIRATFSFNLSRNNVALQVEQRLLRVLPASCKLGQHVAKRRRELIYIFVQLVSPTCVTNAVQLAMQQVERIEKKMERAATVDNLLFYVHTL